VLIRAYEEKDASATLDVFLRAVTETASADYTPEQVAAWAGPKERDLAGWHRRRASSTTIVAEIDGRVIAFTDVSDTGYIDMMFVSPDVGRRGVATAMLAELRTFAQSRNLPELSTHASITARPFFERNGFIALEERHSTVYGVQLRNYRMSHPLGAG
jgi:putative acetyltransferase